MLHLWKQTPNISGSLGLNFVMAMGPQPPVILSHSIYFNAKKNVLTDVLRRFNAFWSHLIIWCLSVGLTSKSNRKPHDLPERGRTSSPEKVIWVILVATNVPQELDRDPKEHITTGPLVFSAAGGFTARWCGWIIGAGKMMTGQWFL